jgi:drug/metabolite transporter (DMT)-like permease
MKINSNIKGVIFLIIAAVIISIQNIAIRWIGGDYSALEIVAVRSLVALPFTILFFYFEGGRGLPNTQSPRLEILRGGVPFSVLYQLYDGSGGVTAGRDRGHPVLRAAHDHFAVGPDPR